MRHELINLSLRSLCQALARGEISALDAANAYLDAMADREPDVHAFITVTADRVRAEAQQRDAARASGAHLGPLHGVPCALKDNICTRGTRTTCASKTLENFVPPYSATVYERLDQAGVTLLGKTNMDEFAMGQTSESSAFGPTRNPAALDRVPGGSSGGSAAAVAALETPFALGTDTGGSILQPAAFCGITGLRPTYGLVSRQGIVAFASSLDQAGPMTRDVRDNALVLDQIVGADPRDATSVTAPDTSSYLDGIEGGVDGMVFGLPDAFFDDGLSPDIKQAIDTTAHALERAGARIETVALPSIGYALPAYVLISSAEASSNLARFDGIHYGHRAAVDGDLEAIYIASRSEGFGVEVKRRLMLGTFALSSGHYDEYYHKAALVRAKIKREFDSVFERIDALLAPVAPTTAWRLGETVGQTVKAYLNDIYTVPIGMAGLPALSLPVGRDACGLPIGLELIGPRFSERTLYRAGVVIEEINT